MKAAILETGRPPGDLADRFTRQYAWFIEQPLAHGMVWETAPPGGAAVWIGLHEDGLFLNSYDVTLPERQVLGTYAAKPSELAAAVHLMAEGRVHVDGWVKAFPLDDGVHAFRRMLAAEGDDVKAVLQP